MSPILAGRGFDFDLALTSVVPSPSPGAFQRTTLVFHDKVAMSCPWHDRAVFLVMKNEIIEAAFCLRRLHAGSICAQKTRKMI